MTLTLAQVRDWLKTVSAAEHFYIGKLDRKQPKSLGVYSRAATGSPFEMALGGPEQTATGVKQISLLLHWNENARETEAAAGALFDALLTAAPLQIGGVRVDVLRLMVPEPVDVGADDSGVYERVIWMDLYYDRQNKERNEA